MLKNKIINSLCVVSIAILGGCKIGVDPTPPPNGGGGTAPQPAVPKPIGFTSVIKVPKILNEISGFYTGATDQDPLWISFNGARDVAASTGLYPGVTVMRVDTAGQPLWAKTYTMPSVGNVGAFAPCASGGGFVVVRRAYSSAAGNNGFLVTRIDNQGAVLWSNSYGASPNSRFDALTFSIVPTADGGSIIAGAEDAALVLFKLGPNGNLLWTRRSTFDFNRIAKPELVELPTGKLAMVTSSMGQVLFVRFSVTGQPEIARTLYSSQSSVRPGSGQLRVLTDGSLTVGVNENGAGFVLQLSQDGYEIQSIGSVGNLALVDYDYSATGEGAFILRNQAQHYFYLLNTSQQRELPGQSLGDNTAIYTSIYNRGSTMQVLSAGAGACYSVGLFDSNGGYLHDEVRVFKTSKAGSNYCPAATQQPFYVSRGNFLTVSSSTASLDGDTPVMLVTTQAPEVINLLATVTRRCQ